MKTLIVLVASLSIVGGEFVDRFAGRITNGQPAAENKFPYQVGLLLNRGGSRDWCGGALISREWLLTATHCIIMGVKDIEILFGAIHRNRPQVTRKVGPEAIVQHPGHVGRHLTNDITLIKFPAVEFSESIQPIRLPSKNTPHSQYAGTEAVASGWGKTHDSPGIVKELNYVRLMVIPNAECSGTFGPETIDANTLCVATHEGRSICAGDSGGPLVAMADNVLIGIASFASGGGCVDDLPSGFTRVTGYLDWIESVTGISY